MEAIMLLKEEKGPRVRKSRIWLRNALRIVLVMMVWVGHYWIYLWLKNGV
jgi:hypothetical protein